MKLMQKSTTPDGRPIRQVVKALQRIEENVLDLFLYDAIQSDSEDWWTGEVIKSETSADYFRQILEEHPDVEQINLFVNSNGGSVREAMGIRAHLLRHKAHKTAYVDGWAASAASFLLTGCDEVCMLTGSMQMLHSMWIIMAGNAKELRKAADDLDQMMAGNKSMYLEKAGDKLSAEKLDEIMDAETWLTADQCVELGLADKIIAATDYKDIQQAVRTEAVAEIAEAIEVEEIELETDPEPEQEADPEQETEEETEENDKRQKGANFLAALVKAAERTNE